MTCAEHAIKCREEVLSNLTQYHIDEKHRPQLEANLNYFKKINLLKDYNNAPINTILTMENKQPITSTVFRNEYRS